MSLRVISLPMFTSQPISFPRVSRTGARCRGADTVVGTSPTAADTTHHRRRLQRQFDPARSLALADCLMAYHPSIPGQILRSWVAVLSSAFGAVGQCVRTSMWPV
jgi:hypothetical protein